MGAGKQHTFLTLWLQRPVFCCCVRLQSKAAVITQKKNSVVVFYILTVGAGKPQQLQMFVKVKKKLVCTLILFVSRSKYEHKCFILFFSVLRISLKINCDILTLVPLLLWDSTLSGSKWRSEVISRSVCPKIHRDIRERIYVYSKNTSNKQPQV